MFTPEIQVHSDITGHFDIKQYPDGSPLVRNANHGKSTTAPEQLILRPKTFESFVTGMFIADAYAERGQKIQNLVLPYTPGSRQDRINPDGDFLFTAKSVARMINERGFDRVLVLDPHSNVSPALIDRCEIFPMADVLRNFNAGFDAVIAPDAGAGHRALEAAQIIDNLPVVQGTKIRDVVTGKLSGFDVKVERGKHYLVFDDICDGGGTFVGLAEKITEQGATAQLFVTHGIFSKGVEALNKHYTHITTTDSTLFDKHGVEEIQVVDRMKQWLKH